MRREAALAALALVSSSALAGVIFCPLVPLLPLAKGD
jgi:hypothetical protein